MLGRHVLSPLPLSSRMPRPAWTPPEPKPALWRRILKRLWRDG